MTEEDVECGAVVCTTHHRVLERIGAFDEQEWGWCGPGHHYVSSADSNWGRESLPYDTFVLLQVRFCLTCGEDRPARDVSVLGWTCAACGVTRDASEGAKNE